MTAALHPPRRRLNRVPMLIVLGIGFVILLAMGMILIHLNRERLAAAEVKDTAARSSPVPDYMLSSLDRTPPADFERERAKPAATEAPKSLVPATEVPRPAAGPTIEEMARANAAAAAWETYWTTRAAVENARLEAQRAGLTSPLIPPAQIPPAAVASSARVEPSDPSTQAITGGLPGGLQLPRGPGGVWAAADQKQAWVNRSSGGGQDHLPSLRHGTVSPFQVMAGTVIQATTKGGMISDAPGQIVGQIAQDVYCNTPAGGLCIPQGSTLILGYNNRVANGERRLQVAAERLIFPDQTSMDLGRMVVADASGYAGLEDEYDTHLGERLLNAALFTTVQGAFTLGSAALGANQVNGQAVESVAQQEARDGMRIPPTLRIRPGFPFTVMLPKDLVFTQPYSPQGFDDDAAEQEVSYR